MFNKKKNLYNNVVVALDFSETSGGVLNHAIALAESENCKLWIIHSEPPVSGFVYYAPSFGYNEIVGFGASSALKINREIYSEKIEDSKQALEIIEKNINEKKIAVEVFLVTTPTADAVLNKAAEVNADLIVIGSHKHGFFYNLLTEHPAEHIIHNAKCPVFIVPESCLEN